MTHQIAKMPTLAIILALTLTASPAASQSEDDFANSALIGKIAECTKITDTAARLACFDREAGALVSAANSGEIKIVEQDSIRKARRELFGYTVPNAGLFKTDGRDDTKESRRLSSTITKVRRVSSIEWHIWIEEGNARWRLKSDAAGFREPKVGEPVEFKPAAMGTFWVKVNGRTRVRGKRIG